MCMALCMCKQQLTFSLFKDEEGANVNLWQIATQYQITIKDNDNSFQLVSFEPSFKLTNTY